MASSSLGTQSPFFHVPAETRVNSEAILHLKRDSLLPIQLRADADDGYAEGAVTNTRFGSFPHSTLIGIEWGSQVRASKVDTGSRGRKKKKTKPGNDQPAVDDANGARPGKRKSGDVEDHSSPSKKLKQQANGEQRPVVNQPAIEAGSGFVHILPPTPEAWTSSLDHRTQVVYTPDYSYVLQRLRVRPGNTVIEAGAGSGSFTHAAARAVFNGYSLQQSTRKKGQQGLGKVYSYEYHAPRVQSLQKEIQDHGLDSIVHLTHRDVCNDGFSLPSSTSAPQADAIFLDLPAPWLALKHLTRSTPNTPLNPSAPIHLCTFSPCIEQVTATVSHLRKTGWTAITMTEIAHRRLDVRRERIGLKEEGLRGVNASAATVDEAVQRLREVESKLSAFHENKAAEGNGGEKVRIQSKAERLEGIRREAEGRKLWREGRLVVRTEGEVKTHTSYLVFAVLPRSWGEEDERRCAKMRPVSESVKD